MSLAHKISIDKQIKIWAASYDIKRDAFRIALEDGRVFLLSRPIPEDDHSEILEVYLEGDGEVFTVLQSSGNEFSVPWDVIESLAAGKMRTINLDIIKLLGQRLKTLRKEHGLSQEKLANIAQIKSTNLAGIEAGTYIPSLSVIERLATAINVPLSYLIKR